MAAAEDPLEVAARALRRRDRSRQDVDARLQKAGVGDADRAETLERLESIGYLDEERFARSRAATLAERGYGNAAIRADLEQQGVEAGPVEAALAGLQPEHDRAAALVERLGASARTAGRLLRKGFEPELVEELVGNRLRAPNGGDDDGRVV
ncbi:MAG TPA: RecX family transcriptional regulator [Gaiellaceae bacterium]|nr:RecX family transcriptional regulator [Gaiellaceae bacterium]